MGFDAVEVSRKAEEYGAPYPRRVLVPMGEDEIHVLRGQKKTDWKCLSKSVHHQQLGCSRVLFYSDFFSPEAEASSFPIPTLDLISLMK